MPRYDHFTISQFYCTCCGRQGIPISRRMSRQREGGHLKKLYCVYCKKDTNHLEYRSFDENWEDFKERLEKEVENYEEI